MKKILVILAATCLLVDLTQAQLTATTGAGGASSIVGYRIAKQGADSRVWQKIVRTVNARGRTTLQTNQAYVELATGMNYLKNGQWMESKEEIDILPDGTAAATQGQHQVYFPGDIYHGEIRLVMPDGKQLRSRPLGLSYFDGNKSVLIAELKKSTGWLADSNHVVYPDAFTDFKADLRYTYTKAGFEQDIILREQPPMPESFGLNPETTRLQVLTEFFNPPQPAVNTTTVPTAAGDLSDDLLSFGVMQMGQGKAFLLGSDSAQAEVNKQWLLLDGRQFLIEEVPVVSLADELNTLPQPAAQMSSGTTPHVIAKTLVLPPQRLAGAGTKALLVAKSPLLSQGLVLDYVTLNSTRTNYTFQGDTTYYISGYVTLFGTNIFEGGAVLKYATNATLYLASAFLPLERQASAYRPVVLTAKDDDTVGETISGSTGNPTNYYAGTALSLCALNPTPTLSYFRIAYAKQAIALVGTSPSFYNGQILNCQNGITHSGGGNIRLRNMLFANVQTNFNCLNHSTFEAQNMTFDSSSNLVTAVDTAYQSVTLKLTNCVLANVINLTNSYVSSNVTCQVVGNNNGFYNSPTFGTGQISTNVNPFQAVGAGNYYLTDGCVFRDTGMTNIDPVLLAALQKKTTYPPMVYSNVTITTNLTLSPQAQRDTDTPDLGYHYDPIDYIVDNIAVTNATLTLTNGVVLATCDGTGIQLQDGSSIVSVGTPLYPNWLVRYSSVQEQSLSLNGAPASGMDISPSYNSVMPDGQYRFTKFACPAGGGGHLCDSGSSSYGNLAIQDCEFWNGTNRLGGASSSVATLKNNLFARSVINASGSGTLSFSNNLVWGTTNVLLNPSGSNAWCAYNNDFDSSTLSGTNLTTGYNAYLKCNGRLYPTNAFDIVSTNSLAYQSSLLGTFYQPTNSPLIRAGSTTADQVGLYHYTVTTNQVVEGTNTVSIGYHYVATDNNGNLLDANSDGIPDYMEDANGDGIADNGESAWSLAIVTQPQSQTVDQGTNVTFSVTATGIEPFSYQWSFNGANIAGATNSTLTITDVQYTNAGFYSVQVFNNSGSVNSSNALLLLNDPPSYTVVAWGDNTYGQTNVPSGLTNALAIAAGWRHSLALKSDSTVVAWGDNSSGQTNVPYTLLNVVKVAAGYDYSLALKNDGAVVAWGDNRCNQTDVPWNAVNVVAISACGLHSLALKNDGTVVAWGNNNFGQCNVPSDLANVVAVAAGGLHSLALESDGTVVAWGNNDYGQTNVPSGLTNVVAVAGCYFHSLALKSDGTVVAWGCNDEGETNVPSGLTNVVAVAGGYQHSLALKGDGTVVVWGSNDYGQTNIPSDLMNVVAIAGGGLHSLALFSNSPPVIITQPTNQTVMVGSNVMFTVTATGTMPLSYQWYFNSVALDDATNATLTINNVQTNNAGNYSVIVSNAFGLMISSNATLTVLVPPSITQQPTSQTNCQGLPVTFTISASGSYLNYQWCKNGANLNDGDNISGATTAALTIISIGTNDVDTYDVVVSNTCGISTSSPVSLTVSPPLLITQQPVSQTNCQGSTVSFIISVSDSQPLNIQWRKNGVNLSDGDNISGATTTNLIISSATTNDAASYDVVVNNNCDTINSSPATLTVNPPPLITQQSTNQTACSGDNTTCNVTISGTGPFTYQWQLNGTNLPNDIITTVAGNGTNGYSGDGGMATNASLYNPIDVTVDSAGDLFIADNGNNRIRKVDINGIIATVAGNGTNDYSGDGGPATNASLNHPCGVAVDAVGNLFIADSVNQYIRKVNTNGIITTVAGNGTNGYSGDGGVATNASLAWPYDVAVDAIGNLLIADTYNNCIRKVDTNGIITTVAGNGTNGYSGDGGAATNANLDTPESIALDVSGNLFISDSYNSRIRKVDTNGVITTVAGGGTGGDGGAATNASLIYPYGVTADAVGDLFISDCNNCVRKVDTNGIITRVAGNGSYSYSGDGSVATNAALAFPCGMVAVDTTGNLFIADVFNNRVREVAFGGSPTLTLNGVTTNDAGNYTVVVTSPYDSVTSAPTALTVNSPPSITQQPAQTNAQASTVSFTVGASGGFLTYQWRKNGNNLSDGGNISGTATVNLTISNVSTNDAASYDVVVNNSCGTATSSSALLIVDSTGNGIPDWWQLKYFGYVGIDPNADPDGDHLTNLQEYQHGSVTTIDVGWRVG